MKPPPSHIQYPQQQLKKKGRTEEGRKKKFCFKNSNFQADFVLLSNYWAQSAKSVLCCFRIFKDRVRRMRGVYCYFRILRGRVRRTRGVYCYFRIFSLFLLNFIHCHIAMPFYMFFSALVFFIYLLYIYVLFRSYIYYY